MAFIEPFRACDLPEEFAVRDMESIEFIFSLSKTLNAMTEKYLERGDTTKVRLLTSFTDNGPQLLHFRMIHGTERLCDIVATVQAREVASVPGMDAKAVREHFPSAHHILRIDMPPPTMLATYSREIHTGTVALMRDVYLLACAALVPAFRSRTVIVHAFAGNVDEDLDDLTVNPSDMVAADYISKSLDLYIESLAVRVRSKSSELVDYFTYAHARCDILFGRCT